MGSGLGLGVGVGVGVGLGVGLSVGVGLGLGSAGVGHLDMARHEVTDRPGAELVVEVVLEQNVSLRDDALQRWQGSETA